MTLNSCPMFTFNGRDSHRVLQSLKIHLPFHRPIGDILPERHKTDDDEAEIALQRLPAPGLRGTWARAYALLTRLVSQIGWDELLKTRSAVFVMEEEYRMQKAQTDVRQTLKSAFPNTVKESDVGTAVIHEDGTVMGSSLDDDASTRGVLAPSTPVPEARDANGIGAIPTIHVSTESLDDADDTSDTTNTDHQDEQKQDKGKGRAMEDNESEEKSHNGISKLNGVDAHTLEKPEQAAAGEDESKGNETSTPASEPFSFSNKRLCERWLDNLFMVLYEVGV